MIKSFEEFASHNGRPLFVFEKFIPNIDREINDIIWESLGVSPSVDSMVKRLVNEINDCLDNNDCERVSDIDIDLIDDELLSKSTIYRLSQIFTIDDIIFDVDCHLMDYSKISDDDFDMASTLNVEAFINNISPNRFELTCYIPTRDFKMCDKGISILEHEIMHAWQHHNKNIDGKKERIYPEWKSSYNTAVSMIKRNVIDMMVIAKAIYYGDLRELCSFTQQAYYDLNAVNNINDVHKQVKKLEIYKGLKSVKDGIKYLECNELPEIFKISKKKLQTILNRRYEKYKRNIARLVLMRKEILEKDMDYLDISRDEIMLMK